jgi:hypothetical protein
MVAKAGQEVWQSNIRGLVAVLKQDRRGEVIHELIQPGMRFTITEEERLLNQDRAADKENDLFLNGTLSPIRILDTAERADEIKNNANLMSKEEMEGLFSLHWKQFGQRVDEISNATTLTHLLDMAKEIDATMKQSEVLKARLEAVAPARYVEVSGMGSGGTIDTGERAPRAVTPR